VIAEAQPPRFGIVRNRDAGRNRFIAPFMLRVGRHLSVGAWLRNGATKRLRPTLREGDKSSNPRRRRQGRRRAGDAQAARSPPEAVMLRLSACRRSIAAFRGVAEGVRSKDSHGGFPAACGASNRGHDRSVRPRRRCRWPRCGVLSQMSMIGSVTRRRVYPEQADAAAGGGGFGDGLQPH
jgi:hypothetical protein